MSMYEVIKEIAKENGVSIAKVERDCGLSSASISKWDKSVPNAKSLNLVANYFGVTIQYLLEKERMGEDKK